MPFCGTRLAVLPCEILKVIRVIRPDVSEQNKKKSLFLKTTTFHEFQVSYLRTILKEKRAIIRFNRMYAVKVMRMMYDQLIFNTRVAIANAATSPMKYFLIGLYGDPFFILNENIGISLTRRRERPTDATRIMYLS